MSLRVWLPLTGDLHNQGLSEVNLTASANSSISQSGKIGSCYQFGTSTSSYLKFNDVNFIKDFKECSVSLWIKILTWNTSYSTYFQFGFSGVNWAHYIFGLLRNSTGSTLCFTISNGTSATNANCLTPSLELNKWYHITLTYKDGHCKIYMNGQLTKDYSTSIVPDFSKVTFGTIGAGGPSGGSYQSNSQINDFRVYDHCLSQKEVKEISKGLILHYPLDNNGLGGKNLLLNSNVNISTSSYAMHDYYFKTGEEPINGKTYTIQLKGQLGAGKTHFGIYNSGGSVSCAALRRTEEKNGVYTTSFTWRVGSSANKYLRVYHMSSSTSAISTIDWIKLEEGSIATPWSPAPSEIDDINVIEDCSGFRNNGIITGDILLNFSSSRYSIASGMDNTNSTNHIEIENILNIDDNILTVSFWINTVKSRNQVFFANSKLSIGTLNSLMYIKSSSSPGYLINNFIDNEWNYITIVRNDNSYLVYVNGQLISDGGASNYYIHNSTKGWLLNRSYNTAYGANAFMSDFRLYVTALSEEDILELYHTAQSIDKNNNLYAYEVTEIE